MDGRRVSRVRIDAAEEDADEPVSGAGTTVIADR
jgi:hypothetical protein